MGRVKSWIYGKTTREGRMRAILAKHGLGLIEDHQANPEQVADRMDKHIRFSLSQTDNGRIEIFACETKTAILLPVSDIAMLIEALQNFDQIGKSPGTIFLDLTS